MRQKNDGVIEAVRYDPGGKIILTRVYERYGAVWSDLFLMDRGQLLENIRKGKKYVTGKRRSYFGNSFEIGHAVHLDGGNIVSEGKTSGRDHLAGIPLF